MLLLALSCIVCVNVSIRDALALISLMRKEVRAHRENERECEDALVTWQLLRPVEDERGLVLRAAVGAALYGFFLFRNSEEGRRASIKERSRQTAREEELRASMMLAVVRWFSGTQMVATFRGMECHHADV